MRKLFRSLLVAVMGLFGTSMMAFADPTTAPTMPTSIDLTYYFALLTLVIAALVMLWPARKAIKLSNRS